METKEAHLYKVGMKEWNRYVYAVADNQQQAAEKVAPDYEADAGRMCVGYVDEVII